MIKALCISNGSQPVLGACDEWTLHLHVTINLVACRGEAREGQTAEGQEAGGGLSLLQPAPINNGAKTGAALDASPNRKKLYSLFFLPHTTCTPTSDTRCVGFAHIHNSRRQLCVLPFNSVLTLVGVSEHPTGRGPHPRRSRAPSPQVEGPIPEDCSVPVAHAGRHLRFDFTDSKWASPQPPPQVREFNRATQRAGETVMFPLLLYYKGYFKEYE